MGYTVSLAFDGAAFLAGNIALFYARTHAESGLGARVFVILLVGASAFFNAQHARIRHDPVYAQFFYAAFPIIAYVLFELESRKERRTALRKAGRIAEPLTSLGRWQLVFFPIKSFKTLRRIELDRLIRIEQRALNNGADVNLDDMLNMGDDSQRARIWAKEHGYRISGRGPLPLEIRQAYYAAISPTVPVIPSLNGHKQ